MMDKIIRCKYCTKDRAKWTGKMYFCYMCRFSWGHTALKMGNLLVGEKND